MSPPRRTGIPGSGRTPTGSICTVNVPTARSWALRTSVRTRTGLRRDYALLRSHPCGDLLNLNGFREVRTEEQLARGARVDLTGRRDGRAYLVEVKKDAPQTELRLNDQVLQFQRYANEAERGVYEGVPVTLVLATPRCSPSGRAFSCTATESRCGTRGGSLKAAERAGLYNEVSRFVSDDIWARAADGEYEEGYGPRRFAAMLASILVGTTSWSQYQNLCKDIFEYLFCSPLETPLWESANWSRGKPPRPDPAQLRRRRDLEVPARDLPRRPRGHRREELQPEDQEGAHPADRAPSQPSRHGPVRHDRIAGKS